MKKMRIGLIARGALLIAGVVLVVCGAYLFYLNQALDSKGYYIGEAYRVDTSAYAFALWVAPLQISSQWDLFNPDDIAQAKWIVSAADPSEEIFVGWADAADGGEYLSRIMYEYPQQWEWDVSPYRAAIIIPSTGIFNTAAPAGPPSQETFWLDSFSTSTSSEIEWDPTWPESDGLKVLMIMNADGSAVVNADIRLGFKVPILCWLPNLLLPLGAALCIIGVLWSKIMPYTFFGLVRQRKKAEKLINKE